MADQTEEELMAALEFEEAAKKEAADKAAADKAKFESEPEIPEVLENPFDDLDRDEAFERHVEWKGALVELDGHSDERHAIHTRLAEIRQFLAGAIEKTEGQTKDFLEGLSHYL
jgi:hypothetical protein